jgi:hypothetical protein
MSADVATRDEAREAEVKHNLHNIQLSVERFAVDTHGSYPPYLIGGEARYAADVDVGESSIRFDSITQCSQREGVSDPLLREGYVDAYPKNPFAGDGRVVHQMQSELPGSLGGWDPLRNTSNSATWLGTRFGAECTAMGSVLADPRYSGWIYYNEPAATIESRDTWANIEYPFWDIWQAEGPRPFLPGQFFYKGAGQITQLGITNSETNPPRPDVIDMYMLGAYGGPDTKGQDVLGGEKPILLPDQPPLWLWTRSQVQVDPEAREGSPFAPPGSPGTSTRPCYENPNGIPDAVILVLTAAMRRAETP